MKPQWLRAPVYATNLSFKVFYKKLTFTLAIATAA